SAAYMGSLPTFDHRDDGLDLCPLTVAPMVEAPLHESAVTAASRLVGGPAVFGRNNRADAVLVARKDVVGLGIETCVTQDHRDSNARQGIGDQQLELIDIRSRTTADVQRKDEMVLGVADHAELGEAMIDHGFPGLASANAPFDEVGAGGAGFQAG